tara:strand:+ start:1019 stop:1225 length:207 start_codon:yes stop_codon:yes gene_type:complete
MIKNELLAKSYDNIGKYDKSFEFFLEANNFIHKIYKEKFKKENYINLITNRINFYSKFDKKNVSQIFH